MRTLRFVWQFLTAPTTAPEPVGLAGPDPVEDMAAALADLRWRVAAVERDIAHIKDRTGVI